MSQSVRKFLFLGALFCVSPLALSADQPAAPPNVPLMMSDEGLKERQDHLLKMHELSNRILAEKDSVKREKLKDEQLQLMKDFEWQHHRRMQRHLNEMTKSPAPVKPSKAP